MGYRENNNKGVLGVLGLTTPFSGYAERLIDKHSFSFILGHEGNYNLYSHHIQALSRIQGQDAGFIAEQFGQDDDGEWTLEAMAYWNKNKVLFQARPSSALVEFDYNSSPRVLEILLSTLNGLSVVYFGLGREYLEIQSMIESMPYISQGFRN